MLEEQLVANAIATLPFSPFRNSLIIVSIDPCLHLGRVEARRESKWAPTEQIQDVNLALPQNFKIEINKHQGITNLDFKVRIRTSS